MISMPVNHITCMAEVDFVFVLMCLFSTLQLCYMHFIDQHVTVSSFTSVHVYDSLVGILHGTLLDHGMDIVPCRKF